MSNTKKYLIIIAGPTAIGKTDLSLKLAKEYNSDIFSCDSRQIYHEMNIGTAKPNSIELNQAQHHFINHISVTENYSVGEYVREFDQRIKQYFIEHDIAILTGGTGLYINAILHGLNEFEAVTPEDIIHYEKLLTESGLEPLQEELKKVDPKYYDRTDINNPRRIIRALSYHRSNHKRFSDAQDEQVIRKLDFTPIKVLLTRDREELYDRINIRVDEMIDAGLVEEVRTLLPVRNYRALDTVGYRELFSHLDGDIDLEEAIRLIKRNSRRYAKRQMTWFRNQEEFTSFHSDQFDDIKEYIDAIRTNDLGN